MQSADIAEVVSEEWLCKVVLVLFDYIANGEPPLRSLRLMHNV